MPALATTTSSPPNAATAASTMLSTWVGGAKGREHDAGRPGVRDSD
ncbi:MAG: hypothetical protein ACKO4R_13605 [Synechococcales cyanobacterium]